MIYNSLNEKNIKQISQSIKKAIITIVILSLLIIVNFVLIYVFQNRENMNLLIFIGSIVLFISSSLILYTIICHLMPNKKKMHFLNNCEKNYEEITGLLLKEESLATKDFNEYSTYLISISEEKSLKILLDINESKLEIGKTYRMKISNNIAFFVEEVL